MNGKTKISGEIVIEYLHKYPTVASRKIAELIMKDVPGLFTDAEAARSQIRYYRGACGEKNRKKLTVETYIPKISIEKPEEEDYTPYILPDDSYPILVGADAHIPYHDQDAVEMFFEYGMQIEAKTIILLGDWLDFYALSHWIKDPRKRNAAEEIALLRKLLTDVRAAFPNAKIVYKYGNHEERWDNYIMTHAPEIYHIPETHLEAQLGLKELGIDIVTNKRIIKAGHLYIIHGHEYVFNISNPVNPARGLYLRAKKSALCGHFHQTSEHTESAISGDMVTCWSLGALCGMHPMWMPLNRWNVGFAKIEMNDGSFSVYNKKIINNKIV